MQNLFADLFESVVSPASEGCAFSDEYIECNDCAHSGCDNSCTSSCANSCFDGDNAYACETCANSCTGSCGGNCSSTCQGWVVNYK